MTACNDESDLQFSADSEVNDSSEDTSTEVAYTEANESDKNFYRKSIQSALKQIDDVEEFTANDATALYGFIDELGANDELLAAEAADQFADAVATKTCQDPNAEESLYQLSERYQMIGLPLQVTGETIEDGAYDSAANLGDVVVVQIFKSRCTPCIAEQKELQALYRQHDESGLQVVSISADKSGAQLEVYLQEHPMPWPVLFDEDALDSHPLLVKYGITKFPTTLIIGKDGNVQTTRGSGRLTQAVTAALAVK